MFGEMGPEIPSDSQQITDQVQEFTRPTHILQRSAAQQIQLFRRYQH